MKGEKDETDERMKGPTPEKGTPAIRLYDVIFFADQLLYLL